MVYNKQQWKNFPSEETPINAARLSHMETQYEEALSEAQKYTDETVSTIPSGPEGPRGPMGDVTPEALQALDDARAEADRAEVFSGTAVAFQDEAVATLIDMPGSATQTQLTAAIGATVAPEVRRLVAPTRVVGKKPSSSVVTPFQGGHNFGIGNADASSMILDATMDKGPYSARLVTKGDGTPATLGRIDVGLPKDFTGQNLRVRLRVGNMVNIQRLTIYAGSGGGFDNRFVWGDPIPYTSSLYREEVNPSVNYSKSGKFVDLDLTFADARVIGSPNRAAIDAWQLRVTDDGTAKVDVNFQEISVVPQSEAFPNGVVSFTFDDGMLSAYELAKPRLDNFGWASTWYMILDVIGQPGYMNLAHMKALDEQGSDISPHCTTLARHSATGGMTALTPDELEQEFTDLKLWMIDNGFVRGRDNYATPQGMFTESMIDTMRRYFASHRSINYHWIDPAHPGDVMRLHCISLPGLGAAISLQQCKDAVTRAVAEGGWVIFLGHKMVEGASTEPLECTKSDFDDLTAHVYNMGIPVRSVSQVLEAL